MNEDPLFAERVGDAVGFLTLNVILATTIMPLLPQGFIALMPVVYVWLVVEVPRAWHWIKNRRALRKFRQDVNAADPLAELDQIR